MVVTGLAGVDAQQQLARQRGVVFGQAECGHRTAFGGVPLLVRIVRRRLDVCYRPPDAFLQERMSLGVRIEPFRQ